MTIDSRIWDRNSRSGRYGRTRPDPRGLPAVRRDAGCLRAERDRTGGPRAAFRRTWARSASRSTTGRPRTPCRRPVTPLARPDCLAGRDAEVRARVVDSRHPIRRSCSSAAGRRLPRFPARSGAATSTPRRPAAAMREGPPEFVVAVFRGGNAVTFPGGERRARLELHRPSPGGGCDGAPDRRSRCSTRHGAPRLTFTRIGDAGRRGLFQVGRMSGRPVFHLALPVDDNGWSPPDYAASLVVRDRIPERREDDRRAPVVRVGLAVSGPPGAARDTDGGRRYQLERAVPVDSTWSERSSRWLGVPRGSGVLLPQGFPGEWNYWVGPAEAGRRGRCPRLERLERLQLSLRREDGVGHRRELRHRGGMGDSSRSSRPRAKFEGEGSR